MNEREIWEALRRIEQRLDALTLICEDILEDMPQATYTAPAGFSFVASQRPPTA
jgi:hypothetical protein